MDDAYDVTSSRPDRQAQREAEIASCREGLRSREPRVRAQSAKRLGELHAACLPALLEATADANPYVRSAAVEALGHAGPEAVNDEVIDCLLAAIDDRNSFVVVAAIRSLGWLRIAAGREQIAGCLQDHNPYVLAAAIRALARLGPPLPLERLAELLDSPNPHVRAAAARTLGALGYTPAVPRLLRNVEAGLTRRPEGHCELAFSHIDALAQLGAREAVPLLIEIARHQVGLRSRAVLALLALQAEEAAPLLAGLLADPSSELRAGLIRLMLQAGYRDALPAVRAALDDPGAAVRIAALKAVAQWQDVAALERVRELAARDRSPHVRVQAVHSLALLAGPQAAAGLAALLSDLNTRVRLAAVTELGRLQALPVEAVVGLQRLAAEEEVLEVAEAARAALATLGTVPAVTAAPPPPRPRAVPEALRGQAEALLAGLERWQQALPSLVGHGDMAELARVDVALTTLIAALRLDQDG
ncbi:MAG TPA: HEAT repeat domain-containing protein [Anaerolineae bacterium]|nr:HEAT repeat domain-containing protein [Anaerolineae bacterium]